MTAYQFVQPWFSKLNTDQSDSALEWAHLRKYLQGIDDGTIPLFNPSLLNTTIGNLNLTGTFNGTLPYLPLSGGTMTGAIAMTSHKITGLSAGTVNGDALRYEQLIGLYLLLTGGELSGVLKTSGGMQALSGAMTQIVSNMSVTGLISLNNGGGTALTIQGFQDGVANQILYFLNNNNTNAVTFVNNGSGTQKFSFVNNANFAIAPNGGAFFYYDGGDAVWRCVSNVTGNRILQTILKTTQSQTTTTSSTFQSTNLSQAIVLASAASKVLVLMSSSIEVQNPNIGSQIAVSIFRGSTSFGDATSGMTVHKAIVVTQDARTTCALSYIDTPSATGSVTYTIKIASLDNTKTVALPDSNLPVASMVLMEIG